MRRAMMPFDKHAALIVRQEQPFNGGPPLQLLPQSFVTPPEFFFVRNHGSVPCVDPVSFRLAVGGMVRRPLSLSLEELRHGFAKTSVTATLQCAGNRRSELTAISPTPGETPWGAEAISTGVWGGVPLREVLLAAEVERYAEHAAFTSLD